MTFSSVVPEAEGNGHQFVVGCLTVFADGLDGLGLDLRHLHIVFIVVLRPFFSGLQELPHRPAAQLLFNFLQKSLKAGLVELLMPPQTLLQLQEVANLVVQDRPRYQCTLIHL